MSYLISVLKFEDSAKVTVLGATSGEKVGKLHALLQSINETSVRKCPENGIYLADVETSKDGAQNWGSLEESTRKDFVTVFGGSLNATAFSFEAYNSNLGNGTGAERKIESTVKTLERATTNEISSFEDKFKAAIAANDDKRANAIASSQKWNESKIDSIMGSYVESDAAKLATAQTKAKRFATV